MPYVRHGETHKFCMIFVFHCAIHSNMKTLASGYVVECNKIEIMLPLFLLLFYF